MRRSRVTAIRLASLTAIVLLAAGRPVGGQQPWYYRGAVINDGPPARSAVLEFAVSERSDTAIVGWLRVHPPLGGSGFAYAELGGDSLEIVTVSAKGDTAVWQSATYGRQLGGRYHVTGGRSAGETGSWSLAGASDPSRAIRIPLAIVLGIALVGGLFLAARQIAPAWWRTRAPLALSPETSERLTGVGGWLAWYLFANVLTAGVLVYRLPTIGSAEGGSSWLMGDIFAGLRPLIVMEEAVHVAQLAGILVGAALLLKRRPEAPAYWTLFLGTLALYGMIDLFAMGELGHRLGKMFGEEFRKEFIDGSATERRQNGRLVAGAFVWGLYWLLSKRVHLTFAPRENAPVVPSEPAVIEEEQAAEARGEMATAVSTTPVAYPSVIPPATPQLTEPTREGLSRRRAAVGRRVGGRRIAFHLGAGPGFG